MATLAQMLAPIFQNLRSGGSAFPVRPPTGFPSYGISAPPPTGMSPMGQNFDPQLFMQQQQQYQQQLWNSQLNRIKADQAKRKTVAAQTAAAKAAPPVFQGIQYWNNDGGG